MSNGKSLQITAEDKDGVRTRSTVIRSENFGHGSKVSISSDEKRQMGAGKGSDVSHVFANMLGGSGKDKDNLFLSTPNFNRGAYKENEFETRKFIRTTEKYYPGKQVEAHTKVTIHPSSNPGADPRMKYDVTSHIDGKEGPSYTTFFNFFGKK